MPKKDNVCKTARQSQCCISMWGNLSNHERGLCSAWSGVGAVEFVVVRCVQTQHHKAVYVVDGSLVICWANYNSSWY